MSSTSPPAAGRNPSRAPDALRPIQIIRHYTDYAEGSVWIAYGKTQVLCNVSLLRGQVPRFRKGTGLGWLTAEYGMLPRATHERNPRAHPPTARNQEIQRIIGRSLRHCIDFRKLGEHTLCIDCDVIQADGGTRTAAITGACVALYDACRHLITTQLVAQTPFTQLVAGVSVGIVAGKPYLDLNYQEDTAADTDMNVVMNAAGAFIEIQGTAEKTPFSSEALADLLALARQGTQALIQYQREALV